MKKILLMAAAALVALTACEPKQTSEEVLADFQSGMEQLMSTYRTSAEKVSDDAALTDEQKEEKFEALQTETMKKMVNLGSSVIRKHPADTTVVPTVLNNIYMYMEDAELDALLGTLDPAFRQNALVSRLSEGIAVRKATAVGKKFTDFTVDHVAGVDKKGAPIIEKKSLSDFVGKGKVMLVDFWSPWCPPCKAEIPNIKAVWEKYHGTDFDVLSVAVWEESRKMDWHNTIDTAAFYGMKWNQLNNGHQEPAALYGIDGIPHMILFDKDGTILKRGDDLRGASMMTAVAEVLGR